MELTKPAEEMIVSAQMFRISANQHQTLCVEHLFYGLLTLSRYLDPPMNKAQYEQEGKAVRDLLSRHVKSIESASYQLKADAEKTGVSFSDAASYVGRAFEIAENAGKSAVDAVSFAAAILEKPTPVIESAYTAFFAERAKLDEKYPVKQPGESNAASPSPNSASGEDETEIERRVAALLEQERLKKEKLEREAIEKSEKEKAEKQKAEKEKAEKEKAEKERIERENRRKEDERSRPAKPANSQLGALLARFAELEAEQNKQTKHGFRKRRGKKERRFTKLGAFTYRGGAFAAGVQYFLYGLLIPTGLLYLLDRFTGAVTYPSTPFVSLLVIGFIVFWMYYILRGINLLIGLKNLPFRHFLDLILFSALLLGLARAFCISYYFIFMPVWLKIVLSLAWILTLSIGASMFQYLADQEDMTRTRIMFQNVTGTPSMIFFRFLAKQLILPVLIFSVFWVFSISVPLWLSKVFAILIFFWLWNVVLTMWMCVELRYQESSRSHRGEIFFRFMFRQHVLLLPVALVFFLYWLFAWFPMQAWVIALLGVYGFVWLGLSLYHLLSLIKGED